MTVDAESVPEQLAQPFPWARPPIDPPEIYAYLRQEQPIVRVTQTGGKPAWLVTRYDDVRAILSDRRATSDVLADGYPHFGAPHESAEERTFLHMDGPQHRIFRRLLARHFSVDKIEALRPRVQQLVDDRIDDMLASPDRTCDLVEALALPVPSTVLSWVMGVRVADQDLFTEATEQVMIGINTGTSEGVESAVRSISVLRNYIESVARERIELEDAGDDIIGQLVKGVQAGEITLQDVINAGYVLIIAGHDTTASMTATGAFTLLQNPAQMAALRTDLELVPSAVEELLRYLTVVHLIVLRVATEDIEIGGVTIPKGEGIVPLNLSANRDDAHFPDAATFDIHRAARDHFAFGHGMHQCIGQTLARLELNVIFETLVRRVPTLKLAVPAAEIKFKQTAPINGVFSLPVSW